MRSLRRRTPRARLTIGFVVLASCALALAAACDDASGDGSTTSSGTSTGSGCSNLGQTCAAQGECCGALVACESAKCCATAGAAAATDGECCTQKREDGACCIDLAAAPTQRCKQDTDCCAGAWCDVGGDGLGDCCVPAGAASPGGLDCCSTTAKPNGMCCSRTPGDCAAPGCPTAQTRCTTAADCCEGVCEHGTCCKFGGTACTNDLECCSQTCGATGFCT